MKSWKLDAPFRDIMIAGKLESVVFPMCTHQKSHEAVMQSYL